MPKQGGVGAAEGDGSAREANLGSPGAELRFPAYRGPAPLLAVLVREGDLNPRAVPVADLAEAWRRRVEREVSLDGALAVEVLSALTDIWADRLGQTARRGEDALPGDPRGPIGLGAEIGHAMRILRDLEEREASVVKRPPLILPGSRMGSVEDLTRALARLVLRHREKGRVVRLWDRPVRSPLFAQTRRILAGLRQNPARVEVLPVGLGRDEQVAALQVALELCRKGRLGLRQEVPYGQIVAGRDLADGPGPGRGLDGAGIPARAGPVEGAGFR